MKPLFFLTLFLFAGTFMATAQKSSGSGTLRHVVLVKFKDTSSSQEVDQVTAEFQSLKKKIRQVKALEWGLNNSPENINDGLTHAFLLTFSSEKDRDDYLVHPEHKKFVEIAGPHLDKVVVVDYWTR